MSICSIDIYIKLIKIARFRLTIHNPFRRKPKPQPSYAKSNECPPAASDGFSGLSCSPLGPVLDPVCILLPSRSTTFMFKHPEVEVFVQKTWRIISRRLFLYSVLIAKKNSCENKGQLFNQRHIAWLTSNCLTKISFQCCNSIKINAFLPD